MSSENSVFVHLNLGIFADPVGEDGRRNTVLFLDIGISFAGLIESNDGFLKFFAVFRGTVFVRHVCFSFLFSLSLILTHLSTFLGHIQLKSKRLKITGAASKFTDTYTVEQMQYLVSHLDTVQNPVDRAYLAIQALHPLRLEEVLGLK